MASDPKPTSREVHLAVEFVKSCPPNTGRPAALAHAFAEYRAELARDPAFILPAAEAMLREAGIKRALLSGPPHDWRDFVEVGANEVAEEGAIDAVDAETLLAGFVAFGKVLAARKPAGEEGG